MSIRARHSRSAYTRAAVSLAYDSVTNLAGLWSFARRCRTAYTGALIRVRRASDSAESDIGYLASGLLDTTTLATFCSGTTGTVKTVYDQSGNSRDLSQGTAGAQPTIYAAAAVKVLGTLPAADFDGGDSLYRTDACGFTGAPAYTIGCACDYDTVGSLFLYGFGKDPFVAAGDLVSIRANTTSVLLAGHNGATSSHGITAGTAEVPTYIVHRLAAGAQIGTTTVRQNGADKAQTASTNPTTTLALSNQAFVMGATQATLPTVSNWFDGRIAEMVAISANISGTQLTALETALAQVIV